MTLLLIILLLNTVLFIILLVSTAIVSKRNEKQLKLIKIDNQCWKSEIREELRVIKSLIEITQLGVISLQDLLHKNK